MRREFAALLCALVPLLAGCSSPGAEAETETPEVFTLELDAGNATPDPGTGVAAARPDATAIYLADDTVTVVNAPTRDERPEVDDA